MTVSVSLASPRSVPPLFALETPELHGVCEGNEGVALPSEGRGQRFESSWVRHYFQQLSMAFWASALRLVRVSVRVTSKRCQHVHGLNPLGARARPTSAIRRIK